MTNREFGEITHGPATPGGPSVDDLIQHRRHRLASPAGEEFTYRTGPAGATDETVLDGGFKAGTGEVSEEEMAQLLRTASRRAQQDQPDHRSYIERRDPMTGGVIRTYSDGRTVEMDEAARGSRSRPAR